MPVRAYHAEPRRDVSCGGSDAEGGADNTADGWRGHDIGDSHRGEDSAAVCRRGVPHARRVAESRHGDAAGRPRHKRRDTARQPLETAENTHGATAERTEDEDTPRHRQRTRRAFASAKAVRLRLAGLHTRTAAVRGMQQNETHTAERHRRTHRLDVFLLGLESERRQRRGTYAARRRGTAHREDGSRHALRHARRADIPAGTRHGRQHNDTHDRHTHTKTGGTRRQRTPQRTVSGTVRLCLATRKRLCRGVRGNSGTGVCRRAGTAETSGERRLRMPAHADNRRPPRRSDGRVSRKGTG